MASIFDRHAATEWKNRALWALQIILAITLVISGGRSLLSWPSSVELFDRLGTGQEFRIVAGLIELTTAALLLYPRTASLGSGVAAVAMFSTSFGHLLITGDDPMPAFGLLIVSLVILSGRVDRVFW